MEIVNLGDENLLNAWHPVACSDDLVPRHLFHARLLGEELAVWRDSEGRANAWENRCPHRGLRLTTGHNLGMELKCQYHGMRFAAGSGRCESVPSNAHEPNPERMGAKTYPVCEKYGLVWVCMGRAKQAPSLDGMDGDDGMTLRAIVVHAAATAVMERLRDYGGGALPAPGVSAGTRDGERLRPHLFTVVTVISGAAASGGAGVLALVVQPADRARSIIHGVISAAPDTASRAVILRHHNDRLCALRDSIESCESAAVSTAT
ncbi:MAG: Rieske (2Fe-2S) protein [Betaproteobacteria bacterium]|nr:Rieske (2Fe-2S) protein [Betaproteobacteria bacterium]